MPVFKPGLAIHRVTLNMLYDLSMSQFPHVRGDYYGIYFTQDVRNVCKVLVQDTQ